MPQPPTIQEHYAIRTKAEAQQLADDLTARGYLALVDYTGTCSTDENGEHYHPYGVVLKLSPAQAAKLAKR